MSLDSAFTHFPILATERLLLRDVRSSDAEALFAMKSNPEVTGHYGQEPHQSIADTWGWIGRLQADYTRRDALPWALTLKGQETAIGACMFWNFSSGFRTAEIGYELHPDFARQGLMAEALRAVLAYGFDEMGLHRIEACPFGENIASLKLLEKLGFQFEGNLRERYFFRGRYLDQLYYGMLKELEAVSYRL